MSTDDPRRVLVLGATGYIGGRLIPDLLEAGFEVRCLARTPATLNDRPWVDRVRVDRGDLLEPESLDGAFEGVDEVVYLVHSIGSGEDFEELERRCAENARRAAERAGVHRIVFLGGLGSDDDDLSPHLRSRHAVGRVLADGPVPVLELRAAVILGSGSASFEMLRGLVEVLPLMVTPKWVQRTRCQPIAVGDVLDRLCAGLARPELRGIAEIGGADVVTYLELMQIYAERAGLRRRIVIGVPVLTPRLSARWVDFVTTLPRPLAVELVEGLQNDVVVTDRPLEIDGVTPPVGVAEAIDAAISAVEDLDIPTRWTPALPSTEAARPQEWDPEWAGGTVLTDERSAASAAPPEAVMAQVRTVGGTEGWLGFQGLWTIRALIDELMGGPGWRRGRRHPTELMTGDIVDVFTVEEISPGHLRLRADMRMPGFGWLEWHAEPAANGGTSLTQIARFVPKGLLGRLYWLTLIPFHALIFERMVRRLAARAEQAVSTESAQAGRTTSA